MVTSTAILLACSLAFNYGRVTPDEQSIWREHGGANRVSRMVGPTKTSQTDNL